MTIVSDKPNLKWRDAAIMAALLLVTVFLYARTAGFEFINLDDPDYVFENTHLRSGLTASSIRWAFLTTSQANWHPLTWLSLLLDVQFFGMHPGPMHLENVLMHCLNAVLVFWLLFTMTGARWPSAWVAAMFAWHPLHVESVAWITERKDVLSTLWMLLCLLAYVGYVRRRGTGRYGLVMALLLLGLMSKSMLVTVPILMLLLDFWPLKRFSRKTVLEKLPMLALVAASAVMSLIAQSAGRSVTSIYTIHPEMRIANAVVSYVVYLRRMVWPANLAIFYPHPAVVHASAVSFASVVACAVGLLLITGLAMLAWRRAPWLSTGWFWYIGTLVPVIGLIQVGMQANADRYTYVPMMGALICCAWTAQAIWAQVGRLGQSAISVVAIGTSVLVLPVAWRQIGFWRDSETVMRHGIDAVPNNYLAHFNLGCALHENGDLSAAQREYEITLQIRPEDADALNNLGLLSGAHGRTDEAAKFFERAIAADPTYAIALNNYGNLLRNQGRTEEARRMYEAAILQDSSIPQANHNLALLEAQAGRLDRAVELWRRAIQSDSDYAEAHYRLGQTMMIKGDSTQAARELRLAVRLDRDRPDMLDALAWVLATSPQSNSQIGAEAANYAKRAVQLTRNSEPAFLDTLAAAQARAGQFQQAQQTAQTAIDLARSQNKIELANRIAARIELYHDQKPYSADGK